MGVLWVLTGTHPCDAPHPGWMMETSERQLFRARFAWYCKWLLSDVYGCGRFTFNLVCLPARSI